MKKTNIAVIYDGLSYAGFNYEDLPLGAARLVGLEQIDQSADQARYAVLGDSLRAFEYQVTAQEAQAFALGGYEGDAPPTVQAWMDATSLDAKAATDSILAKSAAWQTALHEIRALRLKAKQNVLTAASLDQVEDFVDGAVAGITACIAGVGNAA